MFLCRDVQNSSFPAPTGRPQAVILIPSSITVWICEGCLPHWKTPCSQPQDEVTFSKRKFCHTHHCIRKCIEMRLTPGFICLESGSPNYTQQKISLHHPLSWLRSRFLHPAKTPLSLFFYENLPVCPVPHCVMKSLAILSCSFPTWRDSTMAQICQLVLFFSWKVSSRG